MFNVFIALVASTAAGGWVYMLALRQTGGNSQKSLIAGGVSGLGLFVVLLSTLSLIFD